MPGGQHVEKEITAEHVELMNSHRDDAEGSNGKAFSEWTLVSVTSQVVAGTNFDFTINCGDGVTGKMRVFRPLPHTGNPTKMSSFELLG